MNQQPPKDDNPDPERARQIIREALNQEETTRKHIKHAQKRLRFQLADQSSSTREELALEAVQETCRRAIEAATRYDPRHEVRAWPCGILENVVHELVRRFRRQPSSLPSQETFIRQRDAFLNETETTIFFRDCYF